MPSGAGQQENSKHDLGNDEVDDEFHCGKSEGPWLSSQDGMMFLLIG